MADEQLTEAQKERLKQAHEAIEDAQAGLRVRRARRRAGLGVRGERRGFRWLGICRRVLSLGLILFFASVALLVGSGIIEDVAPADAALVLGNTVQPDGKPSPRLEARLARAKVLWQQGLVEKIVVSGATGKEGVPEGSAMRNWLVANGVPERVVIVDDAGATTRASAQNVAKLAKEENWNRVIVVSQYFHTPRARMAVKQEGVSEVGSAWARFFESRDLYSIPRELPSVLAYALRLK